MAFAFSQPVKMYMVMKGLSVQDVDYLEKMQEATSYNPEAAGLAALRRVVRKEIDKRDPKKKKKSK